MRRPRTKSYFLIIWTTEITKKKMELFMALSIRSLLSGANYIFVYFSLNLALGFQFLALLIAAKVGFFLRWLPFHFFLYCFPATIYFGVWLLAFVEILNCTWELGKRVEAHCFNGRRYLWMLRLPFALFIWSLSGSSGKSWPKALRCWSNGAYGWYCVSASYKRFTRLCYRLKFKLIPLDPIFLKWNLGNVHIYFPFASPQQKCN